MEKAFHRVHQETCDEPSLTLWWALGARNSVVRIGPQFRDFIIRPNWHGAGIGPKHIVEKLVRKRKERNISRQPFVRAFEVGSLTLLPMKTHLPCVRDKCQPTCRVFISGIGIAATGKNLQPIQHASNWISVSQLRADLPDAN
jgi:hypothetical protein